MASTRPTAGRPPVIDVVHLSDGCPQQITGDGCENGLLQPIGHPMVKY
jgi:hypothetical protein